MKYKSTIPLSEIKKRLKGKSETQLISLILGCYKLSDEVKYYLSTKLMENEQEGQRMINELKDELSSAFWRERGNEPMIPDLRRAKKVISDLKKITNNPEIIISFMLDYIDHGISFSCKYGDMWEKYYNSIESMFEFMTKIILENSKQINIYQIIGRIEEIVDKSSAFGWGVYDNLSDWTEELKEDLGIKTDD
jgi:hypothetical protein